MKLHALTKTFVALAAGVVALAVQANPAVIYDMGGKFDGSFNQAAYEGIQRWMKETGKKSLETSNSIDFLPVSFIHR